MTMRGNFVWLSLLALAACAGGGNTTATPSPPPCDHGSIVDGQAVLVSPAPGATAVSPSIGAVTYAYGNGALVQAPLVLTTVDGSTTFSAFYPTVTPPPPAPGEVTRLIPTLKSGTTYTVTVGTINLAHAICYVAVSATLGSFTTQ